MSSVAKNAIDERVSDFFSGHLERNYKKGQILLLNGEPVRDIFYLLEGKVKQYDVTYRGDEAVVNVFKPRAFFPMSLAINGGESRFIYEAETDIRVKQAPAGLVVAFVRANPDIIFDLLSRVYLGIDGLLERMTQLMANSAKSRLLFELVTEARRFGTVKDGECHMAIHEKELGARAGLSRETVSREINKLKKDGLLRLEKQGIVIKDLKALEERAAKEI